MSLSSRPQFGAGGRKATEPARSKVTQKKKQLIDFPIFLNTKKYTHGKELA